MKIKCDSELFKINEKLYPCSTSITMDYIGGKWKTVILYHLIDGPKRYNELKKTMPVVTERTLSLQLKQLESDGIVNRKVYTTKPPLKVEYSLTDFGISLIPLLKNIAEWGNKIAEQKAKIIKVEDIKK
ncbi:winged helix-turn-helix transcriptional regulator [Aureibacter tunicatorum]|uniref:DNA-binding HxlR family transcriptional regulator n=1 Tax=Aureibacter tunicatorum TaxID=866807 RepID=A0AAE3XIV3_9BACT|nr:helix-turn-helix domain-containing protein [Aureibacter tunicatorum]MDR6237528.1 DNA-binding HxlR family transcriptional regulator [Aureibacter tunicatorum]BDD02562.1 transcriptional regulator [Aureibacter tunicatorum]